MGWRRDISESALWSKAAGRDRPVWVVTRRWAIVPMATGSDREGELRGQLLCLVFGYHVLSMGSGDFWLAPGSAIDCGPIGQ